jgi:hypothetical protein
MKQMDIICRKCPKPKLEDLSTKALSLESSLQLRKMEVFMDYCGLVGSLEKQAKELLLRVRDNNIWIQSMLIKFIEFQNIEFIRERY